MLQSINQLLYKKKYDVPDFIIVADDPKSLLVDLEFNKQWPALTDLENATLYFEKIVGTPNAVDNKDAQADLGRRSGIGYDGFYEDGNIIRDSKTNKDYIVDTEFNSFRIPINANLEEVLEYGAKKFQYLNDIRTKGRAMLLNIKLD